MITRTAPNGTTVNFPDGTSEEKINAWLSQPKYEAIKVEGTDTKRNFLTDIPLQAVGGVFDAVSNTWGFIEGISDTLGEKSNVGGLVFGKEADNGVIGYKSYKDLVKGGHSNILFGKYGQKDAIRLPEIDEPDTIVGGFTRGISSFVGGFIGGGKLLKGTATFLPTKTAIKATQAITKAPIVPSLAKGVVSDTLVFDEHQGRLTDVIINYAPSMKDTYLGYLASDDGDTFFEGRMKNAIEGLALGGVAEGLFRTLRYTKNKRKQINKEKFSKKQLKEDEKYLERWDENEIPKRITPLKVKTDKFDNLEVDKIINENFDAFKAGKIDFDESLDLGFNVNSFRKLQKEGLRTIQILTQSLEEGLKKIQKPQQYALLERRAERMYGAGNDTNIQKVLKDGEELAGNLEKAPATVVAHEVLTQSLTNFFPKLVRAYKAGQQGVTIKEVEQAQFLLENAFLNTKRIRTGGGRLLNVFQYVKDKAMGFDDLKARLADLTTDYRLYKGDYEKFLDQIVSASSDPHAIQKALMMAGKNKTWNVANEVWINALLSSPKTHLINMSSNVINTFLRPLETMVGSRMSLWMENPAKVALLKQAGIDATYVYAGLFKYLDDVVKYTRIAFKNEDTVLSGGTGRTKIDTPVKAIGGLKGKIIRVPTRFLNAEDEFFKQINGRARLFSLAVRDAIQKNKSKTKIIGQNWKNKKPITEFDAHVEEYFRKGFDETNSIMVEPEALRYAEEATFTQNLHGISKAIQYITNKYPILKQVMPFVRTPINLFKATFDRLPVAGLARKEFRDEFVGRMGGYKMAEARGKQAIGTAIILYTSLALRDKITGGSPKSETFIKTRDLKDLAKTTTGWQPYSLRVGDKTYAFGRLDPFGALLGLVADYNLHYDKLSKEELEKIGNDFNQILWSQGENPLPVSSKIRNTASASWTALTRNALSKTYLTSLTEFLTALTEEDNYALDKFFQNKVGSYIPNVYTKLINDPYFRDARTTLDNIKKRTGSEVQVRYNFRGEALKYQGDFTDRLMDTLVNPFSPKEVTEDKVAEEILRLGQNFSPAKQFLDGVDLTKFANSKGQNAYDRYQELIKDSGLNDYLKQLISTDGYKNLSDPVKIDEQNYDKGGKYKYIKKAVDMHRSKALTQLLSDLTQFKLIEDNRLDLRTSYVRAKRNKAYISAGVEFDKSKLENLYKFANE